MEIDQMETFLAVLTYGGFHRAAEALRVSQPAVTGRIQALEDSLGAKLFVRARSNLSLSPAGKALRPHAEQLLRTVALARQAVREIQPSAGGALRIAASLSVCTYFLPDVMKDFQKANPKVMVSLRSGNSLQVLKMVLDGEADLGFARSLNHPEVETTTLRDDPLILVGHPAHPAAQKRRVRLDEVEALPLIFYDMGSSDGRTEAGVEFSSADCSDARIATAKTGRDRDRGCGIAASESRCGVAAASAFDAGRSGISRIAANCCGGADGDGESAGETTDRAEAQINTELR